MTEQQAKKSLPEILGLMSKEELAALIADDPFFQQQFINQARNQGMANIGAATSSSSEIARILEELGQLKSDVGAVKSEVGAVKSDVGAVKSEVGAVKSDVGAVKSEVAALKNEVAKKEGSIQISSCRTKDHDALLRNLGITVYGRESLISESNNVEYPAFAWAESVESSKENRGNYIDYLGQLKSDVGAVKSDVGAVKSEVGAVKSDVGAVKSEVAALKNEVAKKEG
ncbi:hypothetical protein MP638_006768, partial [Amoeboaphelidium occidentale]